MLATNILILQYVIISAVETIQSNKKLQIVWSDIVVLQTVVSENLLDQGCQEFRRKLHNKYVYIMNTCFNSWSL